MRIFCVKKLGYIRRIKIKIQSRFAKRFDAKIEPFGMKMMLLTQAAATQSLRIAAKGVLKI